MWHAVSSLCLGPEPLGVLLQSVDRVMRRELVGAQAGRARANEHVAKTAEHDAGGERGEPGRQSCGDEDRDGARRGGGGGGGGGGGASTAVLRRRGRGQCQR